ncbi:MAG TPA: oligopeptide transporter, OPT family [Verrucomicrobiae bacterium]|nr:oligopeptide transporter, OPT family [Verrucomicrobiae bacterium]
MEKEVAPKYQPYIADETQIREGTVRAIVTGTLLGMVFGASSLYLALKVGLTVSASIPVAVIAITLYRAWSKVGGRDATILEHNIMQTAGSAGESLAFGVGATLPAMLILGFDLDLVQTLLVTALGGLLGIMMMIPLRRALMVAQHGALKFPEGTACAEVLKAGATEESKAAAAPEWKAASKGRALSASLIFVGFGVGLIYNTLMKAGKLWKDTPEKTFGPPFNGGSVAVEGTPELLGVGYIIGPKIGAIMAGGGVLSYLLLIPLIKFFGSGLTEPLAPGSALIKDMSPNAIRSSYILYIGAGAVAAGGIISLMRSMPLIWHGLREGLKDFRGSMGGALSKRRTDRDLSMKVVLVGLLIVLAAITLAPNLHMNILGALLIVVFGFLFVTVSSRLVGEIGSSSNPISGMTVATLLLTCLIFWMLGWTGREYFVTALSVGAIVCVASSNGGATAQDLKTGFLVGATPRVQQIAIMIGALASALILGPILLKLNDAATVYVPVKEQIATDASKLQRTEQLHGPQAKDDSKTYHVWQKTKEDTGPGAAGRYLVDDSGRAVYLVDPGINGHVTKRPDGSEVRKFDAPKAVLMSYIIEGILGGKLPWGLVLFGVMIAIVLEMVGIPSLAFAVGVYLPLATSAPIFIGGMLRWLVDSRRAKELKAENLDEAELAADADRSPGVLAASGYIAGGAIAGILIAINTELLAGIDKKFTDWAVANNPFWESPTHHNADALSMIPFILLCGFLYFVAREKILARKAA